MMKTCGTTLPLNGVDRILAAANSLNLKPIDMTYSRSSFVFPGRQPFPHDSLDSERKYLTDMSARLGHEISDRTEVLGDENGIFWLIHTKIFASEFVPEPEPRIMVDCIMTGLAPDARADFWKDKTYCDEKNSEAMSAVIQPFDETFRVVGIAFDPCGFSANVHGGTNGDYMSVHVTPEEGFSYASVEGVFGGHFDSEKINTFVQRVVDVFRPDKLLVTVLTNTEEFSSFGSVQPDPASPNYQLENLGSARLQGVHASAALYQRRK
jgi:S-adenosylmethionine decarboxylase